MERFSLQLLAPHLWFWILLLVPALCLAYWAYYRLLAPLTRPARAALWSLRGLAFLIVLFALWQPVASVAWRDSGKPALAVLIDRSGSSALPGPNGLAREEQIRDLLPTIDDALGDRFRLDWYGFADGITPMSGDTLLDAVGATSIGGALESVLLRDESPVDGILIVTDGVNTAGRDPVRIASASPVPVFTVAVGPNAPPRDIEVRRVQANPTGFVGEPAPLRITLASKGLAGRTAQLEVREQGVVRHQQEVSILGDRGLEQEVTTQIVPGGPGLRVFEVTVHAEGDSVPENDRRVVALNILERKTKVLCLADGLDWDLAFLRRALDADTTLEYSYLVQGRPGQWSRVGATGATRAPSTRAELAEYAAVVLVWAGGAGFPADFSAGLPAYVRAGGGLFVLGAARDGSAGPLAGLLPASFEPGSRTTELQRAVLTNEGMRHAVTAVRDDPAQAAQLVGSLPPLWKPAGLRRANPSARTLLELQGPRGAEPALVAAYAARGKVVWMPARGLWRWRLTAAGSDLPTDASSQLALSTVRWIVEPLSRDRFRVDPVRRVTPRGEAVEFTASLWDAAYEPLSGARVTLELSPSAGAAEPLSTIELAAGSEAGGYEAEGPRLPPGEYVYRARAVDGTGRELGSSDGRVWVEEMGPEFARTWSDRETLREIAKRSGGVSVEAAAFASLPGEIPRSLRRVTRTEELELWNHWLVFALFVSVLATEWWLRRRRGLA